MLIREQATVDTLRCVETKVILDLRRLHRLEAHPKYGFTMPA